MNKKGIILSVYVYVLLVFFLLIIGSLLVVLNNTRILSDRIKNEAADKADNTKYGFAIEMTGKKVMCLNYGEEFQDPGFSAKDKEGNSLDVTVTSDLDIWKVGTYTVTYSAKFNNKEKTITRQLKVMKNDYIYTGSAQTFTAPCDGIYKIELWGAQGGRDNSGKGAYTSGEISLNNDSKLYVYVGGRDASGPVAGWNGGGSGHVRAGYTPPYDGGGGGATDVRLVSGNWNNTTSLISRVMVAGGGGGGIVVHTQYYGGAGGGLSGFAGSFPTSPAEINAAAQGGSQISGGVNGAGTSGGGTSGVFGIGGNSEINYGTGGGGGGYYGGGGGGLGNAIHATGGGGSSFISGYVGCNAVDINGTSTDQPTHYSGMQFDNAVMLTGEDVMPNPSGGTEVGHLGNGYARITYLGTINNVDNENYSMKKFAAIGSNIGVKLRIQKPDDATNVMVRRKNTPWTMDDTTSTGTLIGENITLTNSDNTWYNDDTVIVGTRYYYKAFPLVNGLYRYLPYENETSAIGGGLVTEYLFETNLNDTSGANAHSNGSAGITYGNGVSGTTALFNGTTSYAQSPTFLDSGIYSISTWVNSNGTYATQNIAIATAESGGYYLFQDVNQNTYTLGVCFAGAYQLKVIPVPVVNKWVHVAFVVNASNNTRKVYINGSLVFYDTYSGAYCASVLTGADRRTCIGCNPGGALAVGNLFNGKIDQVRMYNRELLPDEVLSLYNE